MDLNKTLYLILDVVIGNIVNVVFLDNIFSDLFQPALGSSTGATLGLLNVLIYVILPIPLGELIKQVTMKLIKSIIW